MVAYFYWKTILWGQKTALILCCGKVEIGLMECQKIFLDKKL